MNKLLVSTSVVLACLPIWATAETSKEQQLIQTKLDAQQQQHQQQLHSAIETQQIKEANVRLSGEKYVDDVFPQNEQNCFPIKQLVVTDYQENNPNPKFIYPSQFHRALSAVYSKGDFTLPACIGSDGINLLLRRIQNHLIESGYVTSRAVVEPQDLRTGMLVLTIIPGKVGHIQLQDQSAMPFANRATLGFAMPISKGDILNIRDIEQGLENFKRVPSADANIELQPSENMGETDILIQYKQRLPFHLTLALDDSGSKATGRLQGSVTFSWDNMLRLNDMFYISLTKSFDRESDDAQGDYGSRNMSWHYSVPLKNYLLSLSGSKYHYHQTVAGAFQSYRYSGKSQQFRANLTRLLWRSSQHKTYINAGFWTKQSSNFVDDTQVKVQRRRTAGWEIGFNHTQYIGQATLQLSANYKRGTGANRALRAPEEKFDEGTSRMQIITANIDFTYSFVLANQPLRFNTSWNAQWNLTPLVQQDKLSIGGRHTVRGFDGELTLAGERGWIWRNELAWNVATKGHEIYLGIDKGIVRSSREELQLGDSLTGGVIGLRGNLWGLNYDYFVGMPIKKPQGFRTNHLTTGFNLSYRF